MELEYELSPRTRLAPGREALLREAARGSRSRRLRADWRLAAVGPRPPSRWRAVLGTQVAGDEGRDARAGSRPAYVLELGSAKDLLNEAADVIAAGPSVTARDGQWIYVKTVESNLTDDEGPGTQTGESWLKYADPSMEDGKAGDDHSPREEYAFLKSLPDDPKKVRAAAREFFYATDESETRTEHEYRALTAVLSRAYAYDAADLAKVYRALATIPGVRAAQVQDAAGRDAIAVYRRNENPWANRDEFLPDPGTYLYTGHRVVARSDSEEVKKGDVVIDGARLATGVVDAEGERP
ncbi:CU044_5270 family protein [Streptomyces sp. NBC_00878]|uniref:CU044_5270 family protein n=1 Tax=Streptomyces sp. NBC_00878 TaxID=2975854 RepID=UPI0022555548|nr:CU044_5270 family protein [Streptomyces sp. NBC_00878]MCX4909701.1 CU044_5270 family protein [Streptomyces sp. NBC_00878]